jgi:hypothetical protein
VGSATAAATAPTTGNTIMLRTWWVVATDARTRPVAAKMSLSVRRSDSATMAAVVSATTGR